MDTRLLVLLDSLRHQWGAAIMISPATGSLGRSLGNSLSQHNIDKWGQVRAADVFVEGVNSIPTAAAFIDLATDVGFTGIGIYPDWEPSIGFHLDTRVDARPGRPAKWGGVRTMQGQRYVTLSDALEGLS